MSDYRTSGEGGPNPGDPVMEDWDPNDPDAVRVHYDLTAWTVDQRAELAAAMAEAAIPHAWSDEDAELLVPDTYEDRADHLIGALEEALGVEPLADGDLGDDGDEDLDDEDDADPRPAAVALAADAEAVEYELDEWNADERSLIADTLIRQGIAHRWESTILLVSPADEATVDAILDDVESGEIDDDVDDEFDADSDDDESGNDQLPFEALTTFFLAGERLAKNPTDADGLARLVEANEMSEVRRPPYGVDQALWRRTRGIAERVVAALVDGDYPDTEAAQQAAQELHDLLRPYI